MPWEINDVNRINNNVKSDSEKKRWVRVANQVLADCQSKNGANCEAKAIRIANSLFVKKEIDDYQMTDVDIRNLIGFFEANSVKSLKEPLWSGVILKVLDYRLKQKIFPIAEFKVSREDIEKIFDEKIKEFKNEIKVVNPPELKYHPFETDDINIEVICKAINEEKRLVTGIVLEPDIVDLQGDTYKAETIEKSAHNYLVKSRVVGHMHNNFEKKMEVVESYVAPVNFKINDHKITKGTWIMVSKVHDDEMWAGIKKGETTGYSIGAKVKYRDL